MKDFHILGMGKYLPQTVVSSDELDAKLSLAPGTAFSKSGVRQRHYACGEKVSHMGARAAQAALTAAGLRLEDVDALVSVGATREQGLPCNAVFIQKAMGGGSSGIACFDLDSTCLSFVTGLDMMANLLGAGRFERVLLVSSEIASNHLNPAHLESSILFGDGAIAWVLGREGDTKARDAGRPSAILASHMASYGDHVDLCGIYGGLSNLPAFQYNESNKDAFLFHMDGRKLFKVTAKVLPEALDQMLSKVGIPLSEVDWVIPHQASESALRLIRKKLNIAEERWVTIIATHGNQISASMPTAFYELQRSGKLEKGQVVLFLGTGAGLGIGLVLLRY